MHDIWNPWHGCHKCSPGCQNCYMYALDEMRDKFDSDVVKKTNSFDYPLKKNRQKQYKVKSGERIRVNMTSDTFIEEADEWRDDMWKIIRKRSDVIFWLLTKRPERMINHLPDDWGEGYENVMLNITCENSDQFLRRWSVFSQIPAKHKGLCLAPLISDMDITVALSSGQIEEVSVGGENYVNPRVCNRAWVEHIASQCYQYRINFCWYESGTLLQVGDNVFQMYSKREQTMYAYKSGLNRKFYDINFKLYDESGRLLDKSELYHKMYNKYSCAFCSNRMVCNGCSDCGKCKRNGRPFELIDLQGVWDYEDLCVK